MKFSIIVPVYNIAPYIGECLDSVLNQTVAEWECICVDDGSTDKSGDILNKYALEDNRFKIVHQKNTGVSAARNTGLAVAIGERVIFLDGDDLMLPECLERFASESGDICFCRHANLDDIVEIEGEWQNELEITLHVCDRGICDACYSHKLLEGINFKDYSLGEDHLFAAEALSRASIVKSSEMCLFKVRERVGSLSRSGMSIRKLRERLCMMPEMIDAFEKNKLHVNVEVFERIGHSVIECFVRDIGLLPKVDREMAWQLWFKFITELSGSVVVKFAIYTRLVIYLLNATKSKCLAKVLCLLPLNTLLWIKGFK